MNIVLKHILYDKITYDNKTLKQKLINFDKKSSKLYKTFLKNNKNKEQNKKFIDELEEIRRTISLYPNTIIEEMEVVINKYDLNIVQVSEADILIYKYYIKEYQIPYAKEFKEFLEFKEEIYYKINTYISEISNVI